MTTTLVTPAFDYSGFSTEPKGKLIWCAAEITKQKSTGLQAMLDMGRYIAEAQAILANKGDGTFGKWIEAECGVSKRSAYNYLHAWERFQNCENLSQLTAEAIYTLSAPSAPPGAAQKAMKLASNGVKITDAIAKGLIAPPSSIVTAITASLPAAKRGLAASPAETTTQAGGLDEEESGSVEVVEVVDLNALEVVQHDLREFERQLHEVARFGRKVLDCDKNEIGRPWCRCYSVLTVIHPLLSIARTIANDLPVGGTPQNPKLFREAQVEAALKN